MMIPFSHLVKQSVVVEFVISLYLRNDSRGELNGYPKKRVTGLIRQ